MNHPLKTLQVGYTRRFTSPLQRIKREMHSYQLGNTECIKPYTIPPWSQRIVMSNSKTIGSTDSLVVTSTSIRNDLIGVGYGIYTPGFTQGQDKLLSYIKYQNVHRAELYPTAEGLRLMDWTTHRVIIIQSRYVSALQSMQRPTTTIRAKGSKKDLRHS